MLFYDYKFLKIGIQGNEGFFISMVLFYDYKFSKVGIQRNEGFFCLKLKRLSIRAAKHTTSGQITSGLTFCVSTDQILTNYAVNQLYATIPCESSPSY